VAMLLARDLPRAASPHGGKETGLGSRYQRPAVLRGHCGFITPARITSAACAYSTRSSSDVRPCV
jgi:hypothetical protein